jgi:hypothetical protein
MKCFHVHVAVANLPDSVRFYTDLFGAKPDVERADYAKWMLADPPVNFGISSRGHKSGVNHLGFQAETATELAELGERASIAAAPGVLKEQEAECCYAKSDKYWVLDPQGLACEHFHTVGEVPILGEDSTMTQIDGQEACCITLHQNKASMGESPTGACCVSMGRREECC